MVTKKCLFFVALILLLSNGSVQSMDIKIIKKQYGYSYDRKLKEYDAFVDTLKHEKYELSDDLGVKSLNGLIELAVAHSDIRYLEKLMEYKEYADYIRSTGLSIYKAWVNNRHVKRIKFLLDAGADINKVIREKPYETLLWLAVHRELGIRMAYSDRSDKVIELLIKRGANVAIKFDENHPTLLDAAEKWVHEKYTKRSELVNLLTNAPKIRANYLKKKTQSKLQKDLQILALKNQAQFGTTLITISQKNFNIHNSIVSVCCPQLFNRLS
jgi:hypothetical protein